MRSQGWSQLCHPVRYPIPLGRTQLLVVGTRGLGHRAEEMQVVFPPGWSGWLCRRGVGIGRGVEMGRGTAGCHPSGAREGENPPGAATLSASETILGRSGLSVHSSRKAFILHIWTRTLRSKKHR